MYVVYEMGTSYKGAKKMHGIVYKMRVMGEYETLDEANEKLKELNARHDRSLYTIILEP